MITPICFNNIKWKTYLIFAIINAVMVPTVYFFYPETALRSLEEMDVIFHKVTGWKGAFTVVRQAKIEPHQYGKNGELLIPIDEVDDKAHAEHKDPKMFTDVDEENQRRLQ
jgi:hypothetical protein